MPSDPDVDGWADAAMALFDSGPYIERLPTIRLPLEPAIALCDGSVSQLARVMDVGRRTIQRWRREGVDFDLADQIAARLGLHPADPGLWPDLWCSDVA